ncbi:TRAP transporter fused permease subunit [Acidobacteria bacterium AH-259-D05]|nr:TRAP transporter fused permease subunit [Acidobacteria bacterium AH-259-D05]
MSHSSQLSGRWHLVLRVIFIGTSLFALYANTFSLLAPNYNRMVHWGLLVPAIFLLYGRDGLLKSAPGLAGIVLAALTVASSVFIVVDWQWYIERTGLVTNWELLSGCLMVLLVLEATRRTIGWFLPVLVTLFILYGFFGQYAPGIFLHKGYGLSRLIGTLYLGSTGIYGLPMEISATYVIMFVIFGMLLTRSGGDRWFIDLSHTLTGRMRAGPALTAILSSAIMGMISGSPVANVVTSGNFTIPLMKRSGFRPRMAGAIEAVASTGGMITPPLMGAGAFLIAEFLNVPYVMVAKAAVLPALLYFLSLMAVVYFTAWRQDLRVQADESLPSLSKTLLQYGHMMPPLFVLVVLIFSGRSLMQAAFWAMGLTIALSLIRSYTRINFSKLMAALEEAARQVIPIAVACASAGIIVGIISLTGLGFTLSGALTTLAEGQPFLLLGVAMVASLSLGMAVPPTAVYIIMAGLTVPAMVEAGFEPLASHFFIFFCSTIGAITPPVALAAYAASAIAGSDVMRTGFTAFRLGIAGYLIPFLVMYRPELMLMGSSGEILLSVMISLLFILGVAFGMQVIAYLWGVVIKRSTLQGE